MKKKCIVLAVFIIACLTGCSTGNTPQTSFTEFNHHAASYFREFYNENSTYTKKQCDISGLSTEGGVVEGYFDGEILKRIKLTLFGELAKSECNYYIIDDKNIYAVLITYEYDTIAYENPKIIKDYLTEFFIMDEKVMKYNAELGDISESENDKNIFIQYQMAKEKISQ